MIKQKYRFMADYDESTIYELSTDDIHDVQKYQYSSRDTNLELEESFHFTNDNSYKETIFEPLK